MGTNFSKDVTLPPLTLQDCLLNGRINITKYYWYRRQCEFRQKSLRRVDYLRKKKRKHECNNTSRKVRQKQVRSVKKHKLIVRDSNGELREIRCEDTLWYILYVAHPLTSTRMENLFRLRFRMPYDSFLRLSHDVSKHNIFQRWSRTDAVGDKPSNIKLLLLGALRYIGRGWTLDDIYKANGVSVDVNHVFLKCFISYGSIVLYKKYVLDPVQMIHVKEREELYAIAGFNGCIGSTDATHVPMLSCPLWASNSHKGFKLNLPARTYNVTVDHCRRILGSTSGHPGSWNDKTLVLFDELITQVKDGQIPNDFIFKLLEKDNKGEVVEVLYKGVWFMVDNGYLSWSCTVPPNNNATRYDTIRFSEWLESMRKDVECLFGIMKGRFCILRNGFRFHTIQDCDRMWLTCCALHNMLLDVDGLHKNWESGTRSDWEVMYNNSIARNSQSNLNTPFAISRLNRHYAMESFNDTGGGNDEENDNHMSEVCDKYKIDGKRIVSKMPLSLFRQCLVNHFHIRFLRNDLIWPRRLKKK